MVLKLLPYGSNRMKRNRQILNLSKIFGSVTGRTYPGRPVRAPVAQRDGSRRRRPFRQRSVRLQDTTILARTGLFSSPILQWPPRSASAASFGLLAQHTVTPVFAEDGVLIRRSRCRASAPLAGVRLRRIKLGTSGAGGALALQRLPRQ